MILSSQRLIFDFLVTEGADHVDVFWRSDVVVNLKRFMAGGIATIHAANTAIHNAILYKEKTTTITMK